MNDFEMGLVPWTVRIFESFFNLPGIRNRKEKVASRLLRYFPFFFLGLMVPLIVYSRIRFILKKIFRIRPAIVYGPTPIINIVPNSKLDRTLGYKSETMVYTAYHITNQFTYNLKPKFHITWLAPFVPYLCFLFAFLRYDIFQYYYDWGFLDWAAIVPRGEFIEYRLLKLGGKKLIFSAYGSDVRIRNVALKMPINICAECLPEEIGKHCICVESKAVKNYNAKAKIAAATLSMGDMIEYTPGSNNSVFYWPIDIDTCPYVGVQTSNSNEPLTVVHAPNHPQFKGSKYLYAAVDQLKAEGLKIDLRVVQGLSNIEARKIYAAADVVAAQFVAGWHGYFEIEAMAIGKPTMVFIAKEKYLLAPEECPLIRCGPLEIANTLRELYFNRKKLSEIGLRSREYVEKFYSFAGAAPRFQKLYEQVW